MLDPGGCRSSSKSILTILSLSLVTVIVIGTVEFCFQQRSTSVSDNYYKTFGDSLSVVSQQYPFLPPSNISTHVAVREYGFRSVLPVHYINLDRSIDRKNYTEDVFNRNNIKLIRIPAIDKTVVDEFLEGGESAPGERSLVASHLKALMTGFHLNMSMILDSLINSSDKDAIPKLSKKIRSKGDYDNIMIFEDDASSFPGMLYSSPWAVERLARSLDENETKWRVAQMQLAFFDSFTWDILTGDVATFKAARKLKNIGRNISTPKSSNSSMTELPDDRKSSVFRKCFSQFAWGSLANMHSRNALTAVGWVNKTSDKWVCGYRGCVSDQIFEDALWSTPPLLTYKMGEGSTGVRPTVDGQNDQAEFHYVTIQTTQSWTALLHDAKSTPRVISVENSSLHPSGPRPTWDRYRNCGFGLHPLEG